MMTPPLMMDKQPEIWTFMLNRADKRNALSNELIEMLIEGVRAAHAERVPLLVFRGVGKNLSAGFDFTGYETQSEGDLLLRMVRIETLLQEIADSPSLTVALAHGLNFGAGVDLFAACRNRYCTSDASFRMPGLKFGLVLGTRRFHTLVGQNNSLSILGSARSFDAQEALRIGFVQNIADTDQWPTLLSKAAETAATLDASTRTQLYQALSLNETDADMAALVRSASRPGLKARIQQYLRG